MVVAVVVVVVVVVVMVNVLAKKRAATRLPPGCTSASFCFGSKTNRIQSNLPPQTYLVVPYDTPYGKRLKPQCWSLASALGLQFRGFKVAGEALLAASGFLAARA